MQISYGHQTQSTSVPKSSYLGIVRVMPSEEQFRMLPLLVLRRLT